MEVADHAAVDTSVRLVAAAGQERMKGFANAVLRRIARERQAWVRDQDPAINIPEWLIQTWRIDYGQETAHALALASLKEAPLDLSARDPDEIPLWARTLEAQILPGGSLRRASGAGNIIDFPGFSEGRWWVQDAAAAFPARLFGDVAGAEIVDLCAAPGGKTAQLAAMGARVIAVDRSAGRMKRMEENLGRLGLADRVRTVCADATLWRPSGGAGSIRFVLLDAPCTATGTIRRHPDVLHLKTPMDMGRMTALQARLLDNAIKMLAPGGILVYCTCSLQKDEGERQIEAILASSAPVRRLPVDPQEVADQPEILTDAGDVRFLPCQTIPQGGMDGFFVARLQKL
ncbi:MAG TPA: RsmB/NOP family class I SAM-dependent RNA methyltransferase [Alphaproteobacteria bacterium]|nr:RsmB/NOP family class I SAM-dependent RNA methyltransferase [Alphaproteobacteria bacterium]